MTPFLEFDIVLKRRSFSLNVKAVIYDGITGIFGPSGHGKTSLLDSITGLVKPNSGYININGKTVFDSNGKIDLTVQNRRVGYVFQDIRLFPHLSVEKNLIYSGSNNNDTTKIQEVVEVLKIRHLLKKMPEVCSGGEKQRVAIGRAILSGSQILIMDEPFSAVDVKLRRDIIPFLIAVNRKFEIPLVVVSHDLPDLLSLTENLILLKDGQISAHGKFQDLILQEANLKIMNESGFYNVLHLYIFAFSKKGNLVLLRGIQNNFEVQVLNQMFQHEIEISQQLRVMIKPENIALSKEPIPRISLRNQIEGTIEKIFNKDGLAFCVVNIGQNIIVEITEASQKNMNLSAGETVFCLFKSAALKIFYVE